ncbi:type II secretion system F family protein [Sphingomonas montana]|uniref:type II secretion system F family protein n=1 Tax=Sphingomonas montana TaxID=1843236 RepID=UPI00096D9FB5|nr:type II secretion system F family protein [Sphingomonas montana]
MTMMPILILVAAMLSAGVMLVAAFAGPSAAKAQNRRIDAVKLRHGTTNVVEAQMRRVLQQRETRLDSYFTRLLPNPETIARKLEATGKDWTIGKYALVSIGIGFGVMILLLVKGAPVLLALFVGLFMGIGLPYKFVGLVTARRIAAFTAKFPDAIELLVRGLRSGLPISETLGVVGSEVPGPVGVEFRGVADKMKIGRTMEAALQETADRLETPEFQFFVITLSIQRETGGNLAETLGNLADVLRKRGQMKLKVRAMASESRASAYILGALPFIVFVMIYMVNSEYMLKFFSDPRLMIAGGGGIVWMSIGAYIMAQMISFEI